MRWEKYKVPLLKLGLIVTGAVAIISLAFVFILNARLKSFEIQNISVRETSEADMRQELEQKLMVYGSADAKALVVRNSLTLPGLTGNEIIVNEAEGVFAANDADGRYYLFSLADGEMLSTYADTTYDRALFIGQNRILLEGSGTFYCFDYTSGMQLWKWQFPYEDCLWQYDDGREVLYIIKVAPDRVTQTVTVNGSQETNLNEDWEDDGYDSDGGNVSEERLVSISHDLYVLNLSDLSVNYIRPTDILEEERQYDTSAIGDISLSDDHSMLLINGSNKDSEEQNGHYYSRAYQLDTITFRAEPESETNDNAGDESSTEPEQPKTSDITVEITARYHENADTGRRIITRFIDNESVLEYSEDFVTRNTSDENNGYEDRQREEDNNNDNPGAYSMTDASELDELDEDPDNVEWTIRKRTLPYGSSVWRISGNGAPTDDVCLDQYKDGDRTYMLLTLSQCAVTLDSEGGRVISQMIDTDDFIFIEPKDVRPTMYITGSGSVIQGKRRYNLGISEITAVEKSGDAYYVSSGNSIFVYTMASNVADSGISLTDSDEIRWNRAVISDDGRYAAVSGQRYLRLYSTEDGSRLYQNICPQSTGPDVIFAGNRLCHPDASGQNFMIYDPDTGQKDTIALPGAVRMQHSFIRSYGNRYVLVAADSGQTVWIIDTETKSICGTYKLKDLCDAAGLKTDGSALEYCRMSPDMHYLVYSVRVSDDAGALSLEACVMDLTTSKVLMNEDLADCLDVVPDELPHLNSASFTYSDDGRYALFVGANNTVCVFDLTKNMCLFKRNCGELSDLPAFTPDNHIVCVTKAGDIYVLDPKDGSFVSVSSEGKAVLTNEPFSMDRPGSQVTLSFDRSSSRMYAQGVKSGRTFVRVYTISGDGILTPETEIPQAVAYGASKVIMRYGEKAAEIFPYPSMDELRNKAAESSQ